MKNMITAGIAVFIALILSLAAFSNCFANGSAGISTSVTVISGNGAPPIVKTVWQSTSSCEESESGDPGHAILGTQVAPNPGFQAQTDVWFWTVATDPAGVNNISHVYADVYYPTSGSVDPGPNGAVKFEVELTRATTDETALDAFNEAYAAGLVTINSETSLSDVRDELDQQSARLYSGFFHFDNCQLAGDYPVAINVANGQNVHGFLSNVVQWLPLTAAEFDFNAVNYGIVAIGIHKQIDGDRVWDTVNGANPATIRNIGNTYLKMTVKEDDMGMGQTHIGSSLVWNIHYDARLGDGDTGNYGNEGYVNFDPAAAAGGNLAAANSTTVPEILKLCVLEKIDFSITVDKDPSTTSNHSYSGLMMLGAVASNGPCTNPPN